MLHKISWLYRPGKLKNKIPWLSRFSRTRTNTASEWMVCVVIIFFIILTLSCTSRSALCTNIDRLSTNFWPNSMTVVRFPSCIQHKTPLSLMLYKERDGKWSDGKRQEEMWWNQKHDGKRNGNKVKLMYGKEGMGREGKGKEVAERDRKGREWKGKDGWEGTRRKVMGKYRKWLEMKGKEEMGSDRKRRDGKGKGKGKGRDRAGSDSKGKKGTGREGKGREEMGSNRKRWEVKAWERIERDRKECDETRRGWKKGRKGKRRSDAN